jgi:hypothetical protein
MNFAQRLILQKEKEDLIVQWGRVFGGSEAARIISFRQALGRPLLNESDDTIFQREEDQALAFRKALRDRASAKPPRKNSKAQSRRTIRSKVRTETEKI